MELNTELYKARNEWDYWEEKDNIAFNNWIARIRKYGLHDTLTKVGRTREIVMESDDGEIVSKAQDILYVLR